jgi:hypothetical protein
MTRRLLRAATAVALTLTVSTGVAGVARAAGTAGYCPDANGVTVVVDFNELGGGTSIRCAPGGQPTGHAALRNAGFTIAGTARWGEAFVCRIQGKPGPQSEPCIDTPPTTAYWSYWHASNGGSWTYSDKGLMSRKPPAGSFEGWSFSLNRASAPAPGVRPVRPAAPPPPPPAPPAPTTGGGTRPAPAGAPPTTTVGQPTLATTATPGATASDGASPESPAAAGTPSTVDAARRATSVPAGTLAGAGLLLALAGAAAVAVWRRRRAGQPDG